MMYNKILFFSTIIFLSFFVFFNSASATVFGVDGVDDTASVINSNKTYNPNENLIGVGRDTGLKDDLKPLTSTVIKGILSVVGTIFFILMVYAGFLWMTAAGNEDRIEKAQQIIFMSVIGVAIIMAAYAITAFVSYSLTGSTK